MSSKTAFITGCSSGIGKATAEYFIEQGWNAAITVRTKKDADSFPKSDALEIFILDVTDTPAIETITKRQLTVLEKLMLWSIMLATVCLAHLRVLPANKLKEKYRQM